MIYPISWALFGLSWGALAGETWIVRRKLNVSWGRAATLSLGVGIPSVIASGAATWALYSLTESIRPAYPAGFWIEVALMVLMWPGLAATLHASAASKLMRNPWRECFKLFAPGKFLFLFLLTLTAITVAMGAR